MPNIDELKPVRVYVTQSLSIPYIVFVKNPDDVDEVHEALQNNLRDAADWEHDGNLYEQWGSGFNSAIENVDKADIEAVEDEDEAEELREKYRDDDQLD